MHSEKTVSSQQGAALLLAVVALAAIGAMVSGSFLAGWLDQRSATTLRFGSAAFEAAEAGAAETIAAWGPAFSRLQLRTDTVAATGGTGLARYTATVTRLNSGTFLVRSEGRRIGAGGALLARRLVGEFVRLEVAAVDHGSALTLGGPASIASAGVVSGSDEIPAGWDSVCSTPSDVPAIRSDGGAILTDSGPPPPVVIDTLIGPATFAAFGSVTFDQLAAQAVHQVTGTVGPLTPFALNGRCELDAASNWGEPLAGPGSVPECFDFFPVVHAPGDLALAGGRGQGVLLVRGDLELSGGAEFAGVVVVLGRVITSGAGGRITGTLLVGGSGTSMLSAGARVSYSSCAVERALEANGSPRRLQARSWGELY